MNSALKKLQAQISRVLSDEDMHLALSSSLRRVRQRMRASFSRFHDLDASRQKASNVRDRTLQKLPTLLEKFETVLVKNRVEVLYVRDAIEAQQEIVRLTKKNAVTRCISSKSMLLEELQIEHALSDSGVEVIRTDLGDRIVQLAGHRPSHVTAPCLHMSTQQISTLLNQRLGLAKSNDARTLARQLSQSLKNAFLQAELGLTGANCAIAENGYIVLIENEGNIKTLLSNAKILVTVVGIEKLVETLTDAAPILDLLPAAATGQNITAYVSFLSPAYKPSSGKRYVMLVDNGRTDAYNAKYGKSLLKCIKCGACMNVCPIYENISGMGYPSRYPGPIGILLEQYLTRQNNDGIEPHILLWLCSLCGACQEVCPVRIRLTELIIAHRSELLPHHAGTMEKMVYKSWSSMYANAGLYSFGSKILHVVTRVAPLLVTLAQKKIGWNTHGRALLSPAKSVLRKSWKKLNKRSNA